MFRENASATRGEPLSQVVPIKVSLTRRHHPGRHGLRFHRLNTGKGYKPNLIPYVECDEYNAVNGHPWPRFRQRNTSNL